MVRVWHAEPRAAAVFADLLDGPESARVQAFRRDADRDRFATGRALAKTLLADELGRPARDIVLETTCAHCGDPGHGKPAVRGATGVFLSIAHSGGRVAVAVGPVEVGVDVEELRAIGDPDVLARRVLSPAERAREPAPDAAHLQAVWVRKEALLKASGHGLARSMASLTVSPPGQPAVLVDSALRELRPDAVTLLDLDLGPGYLACLAVLSPRRPELEVRDVSGVLPQGR